MKLPWLPQGSSPGITRSRRVHHALQLSRLGLQLQCNLTQQKQHQVHLNCIQVYSALLGALDWLDQLPQPCAR